jgi:hypothetical protein
VWVVDPTLPRFGSDSGQRSFGWVVDPTLPRFGSDAYQVGSCARQQNGRDGRVRSVQLQMLSLLLPKKCNLPAEICH